MLHLIAFMIVGYMEVSPGKCQLDMFGYNQVYSIEVPCEEGEQNLKDYDIISKSITHTT